MNCEYLSLMLQMTRFSYCYLPALTRQTHTQVHTYINRKNGVRIFRRTAFLNCPHSSSAWNASTALTDYPDSMRPAPPGTSVNKVGSHFCNSIVNTAVLGIVTAVNKQLLNEENHEVNKSNSYLRIKTNTQLILTQVS